MRRAALFAVALFVLSAAVVLTGCGGSTPETGNPPPPSKEVKTKDGKTKMVVDKID